MKMFKSISLTDAARLYEEIKNGDFSVSIKKILLQDIWFFTDGLTKAY